MNSETTPTNLRFWDEDKGADRAQSLSALGAHLWSASERRRAGNLHCARLYGDIQSLGMDAWGGASYSAMFDGPVVSHNVVASIVDTWTSLSCLVPIRPTFLTKGGDWQARRKARGFQKLVDAGFYISGFRQLEMLLLRDAGIFGTYRAKWWAERNAKGKWQPRVRRCMPGTVMTDETDSTDGRPTFTVERMVIDRGRLAAMFPKHAKAIKELKNTAYEREYGGSLAQEVVADMVEVWEGWHLRSGPDATDGCHAIAAGDLDLTDYDLDDGDWPDPFFPFTVFHYSEPQVGVHGTGIAASLTGRQREINQLMMNIQESQATMAIPRLALPNGSQILTSDMDDSIASIVPTSGEAPIPLIWPAYSQDVYAHLHWLIEQAYALEGYSVQDATGAKAPGLNSGAAQRAYADIVSKRHAERMKRREDANRNAATQIIALFRRCAAADPDFRLTFAGKYELDDIKWADVDLDDEAYEVKCYSASALPLEPAARIQELREMVADEWISKSEAKEQANIPDIDEMLALNNSPYHNILEKLERMLDSEEYSAPDGIIDLNLALQLGGKFYLMVENQGAPESGLRLIRQFLADVDAKLNANPQMGLAPGGGNPAAMPGPAGAPPMPMPNPGMVPQMPMPAPMPGPVPGNVPVGMPPG